MRDWEKVDQYNNLNTRNLDKFGKMMSLGKQPFIQLKLGIQLELKF